MSMWVAALILGQSAKSTIRIPADMAREMARQKPTVEAFARAEALLNDCQWSNAERALRETNRINAGRFPAFTALVRRRVATIRSRQGRDREVVALLRSSAQSWRANLFDCDLAVALARLGRKDQLRRLYHSTKSPSVAKVVRDRGEFLFYRGLPKPALIDYREALRLDPSDRKASGMAARCCREMGLTAEAERFARLAAKPG